MDEIKTAQIGQKEAPAPATAAPIGEEQVKKLMEILQKYKAGKAQTERRIQSTENWWKLRNSAEESSRSAVIDSANYKSRSGWLHNVIVSKHADMMDAYPEPSILPREEGDKAEAKILSSILPCVLEQNEFDSTYSEVGWQKCKSGTGVYKVTWDPRKLNGLGDISITQANLMNLYWEPGVKDIQRSEYFFSTELVSQNQLEAMYPQLAGKIKGNNFLSTRFLYDDAVSTEGKVTVVECYYHKLFGGKNTLQYVKFVNDQVIFATENNPGMAERGLYDHGLYPYVFDPLFPIEGSPCGYGYVDICRNPQTTIDMLNTSFVRNAMVGATPRYFRRADSGVNEEEFLDLTKSLVTVNGNTGEDSLRQIPFQSLDGIYVNFLDRTIEELRETSGNTETSTGNVSSGVTAASAIAALQEASGKGSRDANNASYRAFAKVVNMCIELFRQFYDVPRQFRIVGNYGREQFVSYSNANLRPQAQGMAFGMDMGYRLPVFDIRVSAQKKTPYSKVSQNELAIQLYGLGMFNPSMADQAVMCLDMMDFDGKDELLQKISMNSLMHQKLAQYMQLALTLAMESHPEMVEGISGDIMQFMGGGGNGASVGGVSAGLPDSKGLAQAPESGREGTHMENARSRTQGSTQPDKGGR